MRPTVIALFVGVGIVAFLCGVWIGKTTLTPRPATPTTTITPPTQPHKAAPSKFRLQLLARGKLLAVELSEQRGKETLLIVENSPAFRLEGDQVRIYRHLVGKRVKVWGWKIYPVFTPWNVERRVSEVQVDR
jgi:hypothetical protein